ncbi:MAG: imidazole glycerol phosphate synthase subunit HisF [Microthrixaceae bacterium]|nr:imidazole glycerol phosphate synthase subunit HisF [Microthrixaceae bacterium]
MLRPRVIPVLTLQGDGMVKTTRFSHPRYLGDPVNALRIFNTKEVDELIILDIEATSQDRRPNSDLIRGLAEECFMPITYGGGVASLSDAELVLRAGCEKVSANSALLRDPALVTKLADTFGSQSVVASMDVSRGRLGKYRVRDESGPRRLQNRDPVDWGRELAERGAGELLVTSVDRDGTAEGYDVELTSIISREVSVPVIACGGCGERGDIRDVLVSGAAAAGVGRMFLTRGPHFAALVSYLPPEEIDGLRF